MSVLAPVSGDPGAVRVLADRLGATAERLAAVAGALVGLRDRAVWDGPAGRAFGSRIGPLPGVLDAAARRHRGAVAPLRALAAAMEEAQAVVRTAQREDARAREEHDRLEEHAWGLVAAGVPESDARLLAVRARQREQVEVMDRARSRHAAALARFHDEDRRCARVLRGLADDSLGDPLVYRALRSVSGAGSGLGALGVLAPVAPEVGPLALAGDVGATAGDLGLLVGYGEGDWGELGTGALLGAVGFGGGVLRTGATRGTRLVGDGVEVTRRLTTRERVLAGAAAEARRRMARLRARLQVPGERATPSALLGGPVPAGVGGPGRSVRRAVDRAFLDDWRRATASGTRPMYVAGVTLEAGSRAARPAAEHRRREAP